MTLEEKKQQIAELSYILDELKDKLKEKKKRLNIGHKSVLNSIYEESQDLYYISIDLYLKNNLNLALIYYELANNIYSKYLKMKHKISK